jgi:hypothetical protein
MIGAAVILALPDKATAQSLQVSPTQLSFSSQTQGNAPPPQSVAILAAGQTNVNFAVQITGGGAGIPAPAWLTVNLSRGTTPTRLIVSVNQAGLTSASSPYAAALQISVSNNTGQTPITIPLTLTVSDAPTELVTAPTSLRFAARVQAPGNLSQTLVLNTSGGGGLLYSAAVVAQYPPAFWITAITPSVGEIGPGSPAVLRVDVNTQGLAVGSYHQVIQVTSPAGTLNFPVSLFISDQGPILGLNVSGLRFSVAQGSSVSPPQTVTVQNLGDQASTVSWTADIPYGSNWLTLGVATGTASPGNPGTLSLSPNSAAASLPAGASYALVRVSDPNALDSPQYLVVVLDVEPASSASLSGIIPSGLTFSTASGTPAAQTISVYTSSSTPSAFQVSTITSDGANWLAASATNSNASAQSLGQISVSVNPAGLAAGVYTAGVNIAMGGVLRTANVTLVVAPTNCTATSLALNVTSLANNFVLAAGYPAPLIIQLEDNCGNPVTNGSAVASFSNADAPLPLLGDHQSGTYSATWQPGISASAMAISLTASASCCGSATMQLTGAVNSGATSAPTLVPNGTLNIFYNATDAASYGPGLAPGDVSQVYGTGMATSATGTTVPLPPQMNGTFMLVGALNAPLFYISGTLLNVQIPFELEPNRQYQAVVSSNGTFTLPETLDVVPFQPGIAAFADGTVIAQHSDYSLVTATSPAQPSEPVFIYLAGMGATNPGVASGNPTPLQAVPVTVQPTVTVDGQNAAFVYAGLTPSGVSLYQINLTVPSNVRLGNVDLVVNQNRVIDTASLPVARTASPQPLVLVPNPLNLTTTTGSLTLTLPAPADTNGQIVNLTSSNTAIATVPGKVVISSGTTTTSVNVAAGNVSGTATITASAPGFLSGAATVNVTAAGPGSIIATSGSGQSAAINAVFANPLVVTVKDGSGNPLSGVSVSFTAPISGASGVFAAGMSTATTNASGVATSAAFIANGTVGTYTVTAVAMGLSNTATFSLTNTPGVPASIVATSGSGQSALVNTAFANPLSATVKDANGNPLSGVTVTFTLPSSGASGTFAGGVNTAATNASGVATSAAITANATAGAYSVAASVAGVSTPATFSLTNTAGSAASITAISGNGQSAPTNAPFAIPLAATVKDASGNPLSGVTVTFTVPSSGASAAFAGGLNTATSNAAGVATSAALTANATAGTYGVTASIPGLASTATFTLTNTASGQASITVTSGSGQSAVVNTAFTSPLVVTAKNTSGNPLSGVTVTFAVPSSGASAVFAGGVNTATTNISGVATSAALTANGTVGTYTVMASITGVAATASFSLSNVSNATGNGLGVSVGASVVGQNLQTAGTVNVSQPAPAGGISVTITSSDATKLLLSTSPTGAGSTSIATTIAQGSTSVTFYAYGAASTGTATVTATAASLTAGTATVTLGPSGFVLSGPGGFSVPTISTSPGTTTPLTASAALLDSSLNYMQTQAVAGGVTVSVNVTSSTPAVGTIMGSPVTFTAGSSTATVQFSAAGVGSTTLSVGVPPGFKTPSQYTSVTATVGASGLTAGAVTVGRNLETIASVTLNNPATSAVVVTLTSNNPSQLLLAAGSTATGSPSIVVTVPANASVAQFFVYGLASSGSATFTASATGLGSATGTVSLAPSGIVITGPNSQFPSFVTSVAQGSQPISVFSALLDASDNFVQPMNVAGGLSAAVTVSSSTTSVGTISPATVTITGGNGSATTQFNPASSGSSALSASTPTGFSTPTAANAQRPGPSVTATVNTAGISLIDDGLIGNNLADVGMVGIAPAAPAGGLVVTLTSNDSHLLLSTTGLDKGSASITVTIAAGTTTGSYFIYGLASAGTGSYTATAPGHASRTSTITYAASGIEVQGPSGGQGFATTIAGGPVKISLVSAALDSGGNFLMYQPLAGVASPVTVSLTSSSPATGTISPSATIPAGSGSASATFTPLAAGRTTITVSTPTGYSIPVANSVLALVTL